MSITSEKKREQRLDYYLPEFDFFEKHSIVIHSSPEKVFQAFSSSDMSKSKIISILGSMRLIFERLSPKKSVPGDRKHKGAYFDTILKSPTQPKAKKTSPNNPSPTPENPLLKEMPFMCLLEEVENREMVIGFVGKFWQPRPKMISFTNPTEFINFNESGNGKAAWNLLIESNDDGTVTLSTETRVLSLGGEAKLFRFYWAIIKPFSGWIRLEFLKIIKEKAEE